MIYQIANWINRDREIMPVNSIPKPPSAELKLNQTDQDTLPPYDILDAVLQLYVEEQLSPEDVIEKGYAAETFRWIQRHADSNEYKRRQPAPGLNGTSLAFEIGGRLPTARLYRHV